MTNEKSVDTGSKGSGKGHVVGEAPPPASHLDALHRLVDGLQQGPVLRVLVAVFVGEHVSESLNVRIKVLLRHRFLLGRNTFTQ